MHTYSYLFKSLKHLNRKLGKTKARHFWRKFKDFLIDAGFLAVLDGELMWQRASIESEILLDIHC